MAIFQGKLAIRLVLPLVASILLIFGIFSVILYHSFNSLVELELEERAQTLSETFTLGIENNATDAVAIRLSSLLGSSEDIDDLLILDLSAQQVLGASRWEFSNQHIEAVELLKPYLEYINGPIAYHFDTVEDARGVLISKINTFSSDRTTRRSLALFALVRTERLTANTREQFSAVITLLAASLLLLGLFAYASAYAHVVRPLGAMTSDIQKGHLLGLPALIRYRSNNELGKLSSAYNEHVMDAYRNELAQKEAMQKVNEAYKAKSIFLSTMSHEIRTPMNGVLGMVQVLNKTNLTGYQRRCLDLIKSSGESLVAVINDVLDFSKIEANKLELEVVQFSLEQVCIDTLSLLKSQARNKGLHLYLDYQVNVAEHFWGDPVRIRQVITNLLGNAIKFTDQGSVGLTVSKATKSLGHIIIGVTDTGVGISRDQQDQLFEAFAQADASTTRKYGGTGLGLAISKKIVELMNGSIRVASEQGRGSTFEIEVNLKSKGDVALLGDRGSNQSLCLVGFPWYLEKILVNKMSMYGQEMEIIPHHQSVNLPEYKNVLERSTELVVFVENLTMDEVRSLLDTYEHLLLVVEHMDTFADFSEEDQLRFLEFPCSNREWMKRIYEPKTTTLDNPQKENQVGRLNGKILLAEDAPVNQMVAQELLEHIGLEVVIANDGREALEALQRERDFDLVLMDCMMPNMDGYEATRHIRKLSSPLGDIPIIALTANVAEDARQDCIRAGMNDFLSKPFSEKELQACLASWLLSKKKHMDDLIAPLQTVNKKAK